MLVNIMVDKLVLIKACFEPLSYNFFSKPHPIVNKKIKISTLPPASDALTTRSTGKKVRCLALKMQNIGLVISFSC